MPRTARPSSLELFRAEIEQYEKVEGAPISQDGKVRRLSSVVRENLPAAIKAMLADRATRPGG